MAGSEIQKGSVEHLLGNPDAGKHEADKAASKLFEGSYDQKVAQLAPGDKNAAKPETGTFEGQKFDVKKLATPAELNASRAEDRAALGIDPKDTSAQTFFDKSAQVAVDMYKKISPDYKAEMRKEFGITDKQFGDPAAVREAQIAYQQRKLGMPGASLDALEQRIHLINAGIKNHKLKAPVDVD